MTAEPGHRRPAAGFNGPLANLDDLLPTASRPSRSELALLALTLTGVALSCLALALNASMPAVLGTVGLASAAAASAAWLQARRLSLSPRSQLAPLVLTVFGVALWVFGLALTRGPIPAVLGLAAMAIAAAAGTSGLQRRMSSRGRRRSSPPPHRPDASSSGRTPGT